jgi:hypothetical protein
MFRTVAMTLLVWSASSITGAMASQPLATADSATPQSEAAIQLAKAALAAQLKIADKDIAVTQVEAKTWNDSSMGCGTPGTVALQVITDGYAVSLDAHGRKHRVHVSGKRAIVCDRSALVRNELRRPAHARGLDVMIQKARQDLAERLGVDPTAIRLQGTQAQQWADSGLDCPRAGETVVAGPINGFRLSLKYASRIYSYHSDLKDVRACPAIEAL